MIEFLDFRPSDPRAWGAMPQIFQRVAHFCEEYRSDASIERLGQSILTNFAAEKPLLRVFAFLECIPQPDGSISPVVRGHVLVEVDEWAGKKCLTVIQFELDRDAKIPRETLELGIRVLDEWARVEGASDIRIVARNTAVARLFRSRYGYEPRGVLMKKAVPNG